MTKYEGRIYISDYMFIPIPITIENPDNYEWESVIDGNGYYYLGTHKQTGETVKIGYYND